MVDKIYKLGFVEHESNLDNFVSWKYLKAFVYNVHNFGTNIWNI